jgi:voltage-gated potassium channel
MSKYHFKENWPSWRGKLHEVIFEADTKMGRRFDFTLFWLIIVSVIVVMLESVESLKLKYGFYFLVIEWGLTIFFTLEYIARILTVKKPKGYILSFFGMVDLLSILPTYILFFGVGTHSLMIIRTLRLLRIFRVLKLVKFLKEASMLGRAMKSSRHKISVFLLALMSIVMIMGTIMYLIEPPESGFTSIPESIYWAIVTLTTVGYGDIAPTTVIGKMFASLIMILGYAIIAVPTGIVTNELSIQSKAVRTNTQACPSCSLEGHDDDARYCKFCGESMDGL